MRRPLIWSTVDRWGPGLISLFAMLGLIFYGWVTDQRIARLEGMVIARLEMEASLRMELQTWQAYVVVLQKRLIENGIDVPDSPTISETTDNKNKKEK